jgi:hypothetical protein
VHRLGGRVVDRSAGLDNARLYLSTSRMTWSGSDGSYVLAGLAAGAYTVRVQKTGYALTPGFSNPVPLAASVDRVDFGTTGTPQVVLAESGGATDAVEAGDPDPYTLSLRSRPSSAVTITLAYDTNQLAVSPSALSLAPDDWLAGRSLSVSAVDDSAEETQCLVRVVAHTAASTDPAYDGIAVPDVAVTVTDNEPNTPPWVALTNPTSPRVLLEGRNVLADADALDTVGPVTQVVFYGSGSPLVVCTAAPYHLLWTSPSPGSYGLTAAAWDHRGAVSETAPLDVTVLADSDADAMADAWEELHFGSPAAGDPAADADTDEYTNGQEYELDTDPTNPASLLSTFLDAEGGYPRVQWSTVGGKTYRIRFSDDAAAGFVTLLDITETNVPAGEESVGSFVDDYSLTGSEPAGGLRLYRVSHPVE